MFTKTNAPKGTIPFKDGFNKDSINYGYMANITYDGKQTLYDVVAGLRSSDKTQQLEMDRLANVINDLKQNNVKLSNTLIKLQEQIQVVEQKYYEALKGVITR